MQVMKIFAIFCFMIVTSNLHVPLNHQATFTPGVVNIFGNSRSYLARCNRCGEAAYPDSAGVH